MHCIFNASHSHAQASLTRHRPNPLKPNHLQPPRFAPQKKPKNTERSLPASHPLGGQRGFASPGLQVLTRLGAVCPFDVPKNPEASLEVHGTTRNCPSGRHLRSQARAHDIYENEVGEISRGCQKTSLHLIWRKQFQNNIYICVCVLYQGGWKQTCLCSPSGLSSFMLTIVRARPSSPPKNSAQPLRTPCAARLQCLQLLRNLVGLPPQRHQQFLQLQGPGRHIQQQDLEMMK